MENYNQLKWQGGNKYLRALWFLIKFNYIRWTTINMKITNLTQKTLGNRGYWICTYTSIQRRTFLHTNKGLLSLAFLSWSPSSVLKCLLCWNLPLFQAYYWGDLLKLSQHDLLMGLCREAQGIFLHEELTENDNREFSFTISSLFFYAFFGHLMWINTMFFNKIKTWKLSSNLVKNGGVLTPKNIENKNI